MTEQLKPHVHVTRYEVSLLPLSHANRSLYTLYVESRDQDCWAVTTGLRDCLAADGTWSREMRPTERDDAWLKAHRFDLETALALAREYAPRIVVNGHTALQALHAGQREDET